MKNTLHIDEKLLAEARSVTRAASDTETVRLGLEALVRHAAYERVRALRGTEPAASDVRRRLSPRVAHDEVIQFVRSRRLHGRGIGWIDAHLLASAIVAGPSLWSADVILAKLAADVRAAW
jgi:Arc/MetJ family transcription regulator